MIGRCKSGNSLGSRDTIFIVLRKCMPQNGLNKLEFAIVDGAQDERALLPASPPGERGPTPRAPLVFLFK